MLSCNAKMFYFSQVGVGVGRLLSNLINLAFPWKQRLPVAQLPEDAPH